MKLRRGDRFMATNLLQHQRALVTTWKRSSSAEKGYGEPGWLGYEMQRHREESNSVIWPFFNCFWDFTTGFPVALEADHKELLLLGCPIGLSPGVPWIQMCAMRLQLVFLKAQGEIFASAGALWSNPLPEARGQHLAEELAAGWFGLHLPATTPKVGWDLLSEASWSNVIQGALPFRTSSKSQLETQRSSHRTGVALLRAIHQYFFLILVLITSSLPFQDTAC